MSLKPKPIQINIPAPCHEDWQQMRPDERGRFCGHCQKSVIDFTGWSDAALFNFFNKNTEGVCGRFLVSQVNKPIHIPYQPHSRLYRLVIAAGLVLLFTQPVAAQKQKNAPLVEQAIPKIQDNVSANNAPGEIIGSVTDQNNEPVINAVVQVCEDEDIKETVKTDSNGNYRIGSMAADRYNVRIECENYRGVITTGVIVAPNRYTGVRIKMEPDSTNSLLPLITAYKIPLVDAYNRNGKITEQMIEAMPSRMTGSVSVGELEKMPVR